MKKIMFKAIADLILFGVPVLLMYLAFIFFMFIVHNY